MTTVGEIVTRTQNQYLQPQKEAEVKLAKLPENAELVKAVAEDVLASSKRLLVKVAGKAAKEHQTLAPSKKHPLVFTYYHGAKASSVNINFLKYWYEVGQICWKSVANQTGAFNHSDSSFYKNEDGLFPLWHSGLVISDYIRPRFQALCSLNLQ